MQYDAPVLRKERALHVDLCIVGAGPAGLALAGEFLSGPTSVLVVETGGAGPVPETDALSRVDGPEGPWNGLAAIRGRQVGGTAGRWNTPFRGSTMGAKCVPLDPIDFLPRPDAVDGHAWPITRADLDPWYRKAHGLLGLGPFAYAGAAWNAPSLGASGVVTAVYQFASSAPITVDIPGRIRTDGSVHLLDRATVCRLRHHPREPRVVAADLATTDGGTFTVSADRWVLAAGAVENARLLLVSPTAGGEVPGNAGDWVGRGFMEHPRDHALKLVPGRGILPEALPFFDRHAAADGTLVCGRLGLDEALLRSDRLPNASVSIFPGQQRRSAWSRLRHRLGGGRGPSPPSYGWTALVAPGTTFLDLRLLVNLEQRPDPGNRITLTDQVDPLGVPRARLQWRWTPADEDRLRRLRAALAREFPAAGLGRVEIDPGRPLDPCAAHHAGTTRMHEHPEHGVTDPDGRVHGVENLYVAGGSVFPAAGFANPTLTIVAMALRLADHLKG